MAGSTRANRAEEADAAGRAVFGLSAGVGIVASASIAVSGQTLFIGLPTLALLAALAIGWRVVAAYAGTAVWLLLAPSAHSEAVLAPLAMATLCLAIALGPNRLLSWIAHDAAPAPAPSAAATAQDGWIEEDVRRIG